MIVNIRLAYLVEDVQLQQHLPMLLLMKMQRRRMDLAITVEIANIQNVMFFRLMEINVLTREPKVKNIPRSDFRIQLKKIRLCSRP